MKKYTVILLCICMSLTKVIAQEHCEDAIKKAEAILFKKSPFTDASKLIPALQPCAEQDNAKAQNYLGLVYLNGIGTEVDKNKAHEYISAAAANGYAKAQYNLGRMYEFGDGCDIDFSKAIYWFKRAIENDNQKAAYALGYMYFKGFGVKQDYTKAIHWFNNSTYPMAKHFLGLSYYLGYGVPADKEKALEILLSTPTTNSQTLVSYIQKEQKEKAETAVHETLQAQSNPITEQVVTSSQEKLEYYPEQSMYLNTIDGIWQGKLIQYDWSKKYIRRVLPITMNFKVNEDKTDEIYVTTTIEGQKISSNALWQDETLYFENLNKTITLYKLYPEHPNALTIRYNLLSSTLQHYAQGGSNFLIGNLDTFIPEWKEYGIPMSIVLQPKDANSNIDEETLLALAAQEDQFVKLYPVPFNNQLTVQYELETDSNVYAELVSLNGTNTTVILPTTQQQAGSYTYSIPVDTSLPEGLYIVRIVAGDQINTRMIIKDN